MSESSTETYADSVFPSDGVLDPSTEQALSIRAFELELLDLFDKGLLAGTVHTCVGQEWCAAALHPHLVPGVDAFFATHRGHGHYLAYGGSREAFIAELMGREGALCSGRGGTQNLQHKRFFSAGIQGSSAPIAVGFAWTLKHRGENGVAVAQIGDGTLGEGALYEAFNFAGWLQVPVLFLVENNGWAQSTDTTRTTPGDILQRAAGFGVEASRVSDSDPAALAAHLEKVVARVRGGEPHVVVVDTRRLMAHSKGDDDRAVELVERLRSEDPLTRLLQADDSAREFADRAREEIHRLGMEIADRPVLTAATSDEHAGAESVVSGESLHSDVNAEAAAYGRVAEELNSALHEMMAERDEVVVLGEDLLDPYGGAFKVTKGISTRFPDRILSTPISEAGIVGASNGMALAGMRPVAEIMFADFVTLATDQLINFAAKFHYMYGGRVSCPLTLRLVSGGGRGYGPTHSQSLESLFCGVPGLRVVALSQRHQPGRLLREVVAGSDDPVVFVENKLLYALRPHDAAPLDLRPEPVDGTAGQLPPLRYVPAGGTAPDVTVVTYGGMTTAAEAAMRDLIVSDELAFDYFVMTQLWPLDVGPIVESVRRTGRLVVVEEGVATYGVSAAVIAAVAEQLGTAFAGRAVGAFPVPLPSARHLEDAVLPSAGRVADAVRAML